MRNRKPTDRQLIVLELLSSGLSEQEVGRAMFISQSTVHTHVGSMRRAMQARNHAHMVAIAYEEGWLPVEIEEQRLEIVR